MTMVDVVVWQRTKNVRHAGLTAAPLRKGCSAGRTGDGEVTEKQNCLMHRHAIHRIRWYNVSVSGGESGFADSTQSLAGLGVAMERADR